jgi:transcriptional regulator with XRE-family HTH domain
MAKKNKALQKLRVDLEITQDEAAQRMNVSPATYRQVECGLRRGSNDFWDKFQSAFKIPDADMRTYQKGE